MKKILSILLVLVLALSIFSSCANNDVKIGLNENATLTIKGGSFELTLDSEQMAKQELVDINCSTISSSGETTKVSAKGFSLGKIVSQQGEKLSDYSGVTFNANDGYIMQANAEEYAETDIYVLLELDGEALEYPRSCIPDRRTMYWVKNLEKIQLNDGKTEQTQSEKVSEISFFVEVINDLTAEKVDNRGVKVDSYSLKKYFEKAFEKTQSERLKLIAKDGFSKSENAELFFANYVSLDVDVVSAPLYFSDTISDGMRVKGIDVAIGNGVAVYFGKEIDVLKLFEMVGMKDAENYLFVASDGFETSVPKDALKFGKVFFDTEKNMLRASFDGYDFGDVKGGGKVKYLVSVKTA